MEDVKKIISETQQENPFTTLWGNWYRGNFDSYHNINIWNGKRFLAYRLKSLNMAKKVCEDWADLLLNEKM